MALTRDYQLILFDFDGLLVNTEEIHFRAYQKMCEKRGFNLPFDFDAFCQIAHYRSSGIREEVYKNLPDLEKQESNWDLLYQEKKLTFLELIEKGKVELMEGAHELLEVLEKQKIKRCVVTHSGKALVDSIRKCLPVLNTIPHWLTREDYERPKPEPDCYFKAISLYASPNDRVLGFEDTPRGLSALMKTRAEPILVAKFDYPEIPTFEKQGVRVLKSLKDIL